MNFLYDDWHCYGRYMLLLSLLNFFFLKMFPVSILHKSIAGRYRPVRVADGPITARFRFIKNASWVIVWVVSCGIFRTRPCEDLPIKFGSS